MLGHPVQTDPEIAAATFRTHLERLAASGAVKELGVTWDFIDNLHVLVHFEGLRADGTRDPYRVLLGAEFYDLWPPTAAFIDPETMQPPVATSPWWPAITNPPWGAFHHAYPFQNAQPRQLICITFVAEYYMTQHNPSELSVWRQGKHTVAATITRIAELLRSPIYRQPSG